MRTLTERIITGQSYVAYEGRFFVVKIMELVEGSGELARMVL